MCAFDWEIYIYIYSIVDKIKNVVGTTLYIYICVYSIVDTNKECCWYNIVKVASSNNFYSFWSRFSSDFTNLVGVSLSSYNGITDHCKGNLMIGLCSIRLVLLINLYVLE